MELPPTQAEADLARQLSTPTPPLADLVGACFFMLQQIDARLADLAELRGDLNEALKQIAASYQLIASRLAPPDDADAPWRASLGDDE